MRFFNLILIILTITSCTQRFKNTRIAALRLQSFIETSLSVSNDSDRLKLLPFLDGQMAKDIATMNKEEFIEKFIENRVVLKKFEVVDTQAVDDNSIQLLYKLRYIKPSEEEKIEVETEKVALMTFSKDHWRISVIYDISTQYYFPDALVTKKPGSIF